MPGTGTHYGIVVNPCRVTNHKSWVHRDPYGAARGGAERSRLPADDAARVRAAQRRRRGKGGAG